MIEIFVLTLLCNKNSKNAKLRGKSGGGAVGYTLALWIGGEILGGIIGGVANMGMGAYLLAIGFAVFGGIVSYRISKKGNETANAGSNDYIMEGKERRQAVYRIRRTAGSNDSIMESKERVAEKMLKRGTPIEIVAEDTELPVEEIQRMAQKIKNEQDNNKNDSV